MYNDYYYYVFIHNDIVIFIIFKNIILKFSFNFQTKMLV